MLSGLFVTASTARRCSVRSVNCAGVKLGASRVFTSCPCAETLKVKAYAEEVSLFSSSKEAQFTLIAQTDDLKIERPGHGPLAS